MTEDEKLDKSMEEALNLSMQEVAKEVGKPLAARREPSISSSVSVLDYEKLMDIGSRLLKQKMDEHMNAVSTYELMRMELIDSYRIRMERLKIEADEQLRNLEQIHQTKLDSLEKLINKLRILRET